MATILYFAYGSNLSRTQMRQRCPGAVLVGTAVLPGHRLAFTHHSQRWGGGVADVVVDPGVEVWGLLYELRPGDLDALDHYEGHPDRYSRHRTTVQTERGPVDDVWVYTVVDKLEHVPPTRAYLAPILEAADTFAFPAAHLDRLHRAVGQQDGSGHPTEQTPGHAGPFPVLPSHDMPADPHVLAALDRAGVDYTVIDCDPDLADTADFCAAYGIDPSESANAILVASRKPEGHHAVCVVLATHRLDVNTAVRKRMGVRKVSFATEEQTRELTGMQIGGVTVAGLPEGVPVWVDADVTKVPKVVVGAGTRSAKIRLPGRQFSRLPGVEVVEGLATRS